MGKSLLVGCFLLVIFTFAQAQESLTITTFYPSPNGSYNQLQTTTFGVGDNNNNGNLDSGDVPLPNLTPGEVWIRGRVGLGTRVPTERLHVSDSLTAGGTLRALVEQTTAASTAELQTKAGPAGSVAEFRVGSVGGASVQLREVSNYPMLFFTHNVERMRILGDRPGGGGEVGIGTAAPAQKLHVLSTAAEAQDCRIVAEAPAGYYSGFNIYSAGASVGGLFYRAIDGRMSWWNGGERISILNANGNVGINTLLPGARLSVQGTLGVGDAGYAAAVVPAGSSAIIQNNVGIGTATPTSRLSVLGAVAVGDAGYANLAGGAPALTSAIFQNKVGIGTTTPGAKLSVAGGLAVGTPYIAEAPFDGNLLVSGNTALGASSPAGYRLLVNGNSKMDGTLTIVGAIIGGDVAEDIGCDNCAAADVVVIDQKSNRKVMKSTQAYDYTVAGVISTQPSFRISSSGGQDSKPLALAGQVKCKVTNENGPIKRGDPLVTSSKPGYAMRGDIDKVKPGMVIGKALEPLEQGDGIITILISAN